MSQPLNEADAYRLLVIRATHIVQNLPAADYTAADVALIEEAAMKIMERGSQLGAGYTEQEQAIVSAYGVLFGEEEASPPTLTRQARPATAYNRPFVASPPPSPAAQARREPYLTPQQGSFREIPSGWRPAARRVVSQPIQGDNSSFIRRTLDEIHGTVPRAPSMLSGLTSISGLTGLSNADPAQLSRQQAQRIADLMRRNPNTFRLPARAPNGRAIPRLPDLPNIGTYSSIHDANLPDSRADLQAEIDMRHRDHASVLQYLVANDGLLWRLKMKEQGMGQAGDRK